MTFKTASTEQGTPMSPLLTAAAGSHDDAPSTIVAPAVKSDGSEGLPPTLLTAPLPSDPTRTAHSVAAPTAQPAIRPALFHAPERYQILNEHGRGGLGRVSRAHDRDLGRDVAIKELISRTSISEIRFLREAMITARLEHPGIVPMYEAGRWPDGTPYYAMKLVAGRPLRDLIAERTTVDQRIGLLHHVIAVADAIAYAHGRNIIHRDLKPANVIVGDFGETIVIDWGLAKDLSSSCEEPAIAGSPSHSPSSNDLTAAGVVLGTPSYMPPEQERGEHVDQRADVFAIGAMLWEICSLQKVPPTNLRQRRRLLRHAGIDQDLAVIIDKALNPDPECRYPDAAGLAADLKAFKSGARISARSYSLFAMLAHWTRRHRTLSLAIVSATLLATAGGTLYIRNIAAESVRADNALSMAQRERDSAKLSEASLLVEKDPSKAQAVLYSLHLRSPQYALVASRAKQGAAERVVSMSANVRGLFHSRNNLGIGLLTSDRELYELDVQSGIKTLIDRDLDQEGPVIIHRGEWLYTRKPFRANMSHVWTPNHSLSINVRSLTNISRLASLDDAAYALDSSGNLYRANDSSPVLARRNVHSIAGGGKLLLICLLNGSLEVLRDNTIVYSGRCPQTRSPESMATSTGHYAALSDTGTLTAYRHGDMVQVHTPIHGEYELALSSTGLVALADYSPAGGPWFLRPDSDELEPGPMHASQLASVASGGRFAAWGYNDGTVMAIDTTTGAVWEFKGHPDPTYYIIIDDANAQLISASSQELRVWALRRPPVIRIKSMPCNSFNIQPSPDGGRVALDCSDGSVWVWSRSTGTVTRVQQHVGLAFGVQWMGELLCSSGWDGRILCSTSDGNAQNVFDPHAGRVPWLAANPRHDSLFLATIDGRVWKLDDTLHELYSHDAIPYRLTVSADGSRLASCDLEGSLIIFDLNRNRIQSRTLAHSGAIYSMTWLDNDIWTSGVDGPIRTWTVETDHLELRNTETASGPVRLTRVFEGGWAANTAVSSLLIKYGRTPAPLHLELNKRMIAIDVSPTGEYVAGSVGGEIIVVDLRRRRLASISMDTGSSGNIKFVDPVSLAVSAATALKLVNIENLYYVSFD
jgi:eukaryotic-like serine/threonine-protein kinase